MAPVTRLMSTTVPGEHDVFGLRYFGQYYAMTGDPDLTAEICDEMIFAKAHAPSLYALREVASDGLFTAFADEPNWSLAHDLLAPAFTKQAMRRHHDVMVSVADELVDRWTRSAGGVDVSHEMTRTTFETIARAGFGRPYGLLESDGRQVHPMVRASEVVLRTGLIKGAISGVPGSGIIERSVDLWALRHRRYAAAHLSAIVDDAIAGRIPGRSTPGNIMDLMIGGDGTVSLDREAIIRQLLTFLIAGHETTSGMLSFALFYLLRDPELLDRAIDEAQAAHSDSTSPSGLAYEQVAKMRFLRRVLDESLRLWPTVPGIARRPRFDYFLGGRYAMRPDNWIIVFFHHLHRHPDVWSRPNHFDPDRFEVAAARLRPPHVYKPFGTGIRACIGRQFAIHEALVILSRLLVEFDFTPDPAYTLSVDERLTLMPRGFHVTARRR